MLLYIITGSIMFVCLIGLIVCGKKQHNFKAAQSLAILFMLLVVVCGVVMLIHYQKSKDPQRYVNDNLKFQRASGYVLAKHLGKGLPGAQVIVLLDKSRNDEPIQKALIEGMEKGFEDTTKDIIYITPNVKIPKNQNGNQSGIMDLVQSQDLNFTLARYPKCKILISLIGLPKDINGLSLVEKYTKDPKNAVRLGLLHYGVEYSHPYIKAGFISAAVKADPTKKYSMETPSRDIQETFEKRFLLITSENADKIARQYPGKIFRNVKF